MATVMLPTVTEIFPGAWTASGIVSALDSHYSGSSKFTREYTGTDSFVISPTSDPQVGVGTAPQFSFRATSATEISLEIEPAGTLTDSGDTSTRPSGASADNSGAGRYLTLGTIGAGSRCFVVEWEDCTAVMLTSTTPTSWQPSIMIGRVYVPDFPDIDIPRGRDGLGFFVGAPHFSTGSVTPDSWIEGSGPSTGSAIHIATGIWDEPDLNETIGASNADNLTYVGFVRPFMFAIKQLAVTDSTIGLVKYVYGKGAQVAPLARQKAGATGDLCYMPLGLAGSTANTFLLMPWDKNVS